MAHATMIDTLAYAKRRIAVGMPQKQAEEQVEIFAEIFEENIATTQDIESIRRDMKEMEGSLQLEMKVLQRDMKEIESSLKRDMKELEMRMTIRLGAIMTAGIAVVATLVKLL